MAKATPKPSAKPTGKMAQAAKAGAKAKPLPKPEPKFTRKPGEITPAIRKEMAKMSPVDRGRYMAMIKGEKTADKRSRNTI